jgi:hypothetical protein
MVLPVSEDTDTNDIARLVSDVSSTTEFVERHLLRLVREAARGEVAVRELTEELSALSADLQRSYQQVADAADRRDLSFRAVTTLEQLGQRCLWLYRKMHLERAFYVKLDLEARLRSMISPEGYAVYQEILCIDHDERGLLAQSDTELRSALLGVC